MREVANRLWFAHPLAVVESDDIGPRTRVWAFAHVMAGAKVGCDCNLCDHSFLETGAVIGDNVTVKNGVAIWNGVTVEDNVFLGPHCVLTNDPNPRAYIKKDVKMLTPTLIRANATIGANATIVCGITIGHYAFVGANSVVIRSIPDFALVVGNPARQIGWMCVCAKRVSVSEQIGSLIACSHCGRTFSVTKNGLSLEPLLEEIS